MAQRAERLSAGFQRRFAGRDLRELEAMLTEGQDRCSTAWRTIRTPRFSIPR